MHNQRTLHLTDKQMSFVNSVLECDKNGEIPAKNLIAAIVDEGIFQYPAEVLVAQHKEKFNKADVQKAA